MADVMTQEQRKNNMRAIKARSKLEDKVSKALWNKGFRFRKNRKKLMGKPDLSIQKYQIVIFIDSCFWHQCPIHGNMPKNNQEFWQKKLTRNMERDKEVNRYYKESGWNVLRVWEHDLKKDFEGTVNAIADFITFHRSN